MVLRLGMAMVMTAVWLVATPAHAQTLGDATAATGVQGTLARSGTMNPAGTIATVKNALGKAVATKQGQLAGSGLSWGGKGGGASAWVTSSGGGGWATKGGSSGWLMASAGGGWGTAGKGAGAWASGAWGGH